MTERSRWRRKASFTVEASVILCVFLFLIGGFADLSLKLYGENMQQIRDYRREYLMEVPQALRIKHLGGNEYEQYRLQHNI